jgi:hypothetical protein
MLLLPPCKEHPAKGYGGYYSNPYRHLTDPYMVVRLPAMLINPMGQGQGGQSK